VSASLHDFIVANRAEIVDRARKRFGDRAPPNFAEGPLDHGVPVFLQQLTDALAPTPAASAGALVAEAGTTTRINDSAALHGHELLRSGYSVAQVVHGYGDVCQIVTELAGELNAAISTEDFQAFNGYLDDAIAGAVTAYGSQRETDLADEGTERLGVFAHELRNLLNTAVLSFDAIKRGTVGLGGSTGAVHSRSLSELRVLVERSLIDVRMARPMLEPLSLSTFIAEMALIAAIDAEKRGVRFTVDPIEGDNVIDVDRHLLASAVSNLLQNAFKFTRPGGGVVLSARAAAERVFIEVSDECGGLPSGKPEELFVPFTRRSSNGPGLGLGLSIALSATRANLGTLSVHDIPGHGCVFTLDLPRSRRAVPQA